MSETSLEELVEERQFAGILQTHAEVLFRLANTLQGSQPEQAPAEWTKKHYFQLFNEADNLESFLDDYGARYNRTYAFLTELVASLRWFAQTGYSLAHLAGRLESYGAGRWMPLRDFETAVRSVERVRGFVRGVLERVLAEMRREAGKLGVEITPEAFPESNFTRVTARLRLPRNVGQADLVDEEQKIAEVATKYLQACEMLAEVGVRAIDDPAERGRFLTRACTEEQARVYEATVHNLQSTYDTHVQNTVLEARDERLSELRGHISAALHLLEAVTYLTHFIERHETELRSEEAKRRISEIIPTAEVQELVLNELLSWANRFLQSGGAIAEELLPSYTNVQELTIELPDSVSLHARPAALIVGIVNHHRTPVEMELGEKRCNASSILELLITVGSKPDARRYVFRGDEHPLRDIRLLFESGLGEAGMESLPEALSYLRNQ